MKYNQPLDHEEDAPYIQAVPTEGIEGSPVPAEALEHPQREIVNAIREAGLTPDKADLTQLAQAIEILIRRFMPQTPELYELCEVYHFRHPTLRPGFQPAQGGLINNAATLYPDAWAYLQTIEGQKLCKPEAEWQAMTRAVWHTNADGSQVGWNGIGGAPFYAPNTATGALRLPDLRGMYAEAAGYDSLGVGGVHGDAIRNITGHAGLMWIQGLSVSGALSVGSSNEGAYSTGAGEVHRQNLYIDVSRVAPTASQNQPRAWGALACVYLGLPAS